MGKRGITNIVVLAILLCFDFIVNKFYESGKVLFDTKMALAQMSNSDISYLNYSLYNNSNIYYGIMFFINVIVLTILIIINIRGMEE